MKPSDGEPYPKDDEARDRFEADMAEILAEEKRTECPAARAIREAAANSVDSTLRAYRCQHTDDGDGGCVGLADALSPLADATIRRGLDEIRLLVDAVAGDIEAIPIPPCDAYERGRADALAEAAALVANLAELAGRPVSKVAARIRALAPASHTHVSVRREALAASVSKGHHDTCSTALVEGLACDCGHDDLRAALPGGTDGE